MHWGSLLETLQTASGQRATKGAGKQPVPHATPVAVVLPDGRVVRARAAELRVVRELGGELAAVIDTREQV